MNVQYPPKQVHPHPNRFINQELFHQRQGNQQYNHSNSHSPSVGRSPITYHSIQGKPNAHHSPQNLIIQQQIAHRPPSQQSNPPSIVIKPPSFNQSSGFTRDQALKPESVKRMETIVRNNQTQQQSQSRISHINISGDRHHQQISNNPNNYPHQRINTNQSTNIQQQFYQMEGNRRSNTLNYSPVTPMGQLHESNSLPKKHPIISNQTANQVNQEQVRRNQAVLRQENRKIGSYHRSQQHHTQSRAPLNIKNNEGVTSIKTVEQMPKNSLGIQQKAAGKVLKVYSSYEQYLTQKQSAPAPKFGTNLQYSKQTIKVSSQQQKNQSIHHKNGEKMTLYEPRLLEQNHVMVHEPDRVLEHQLNFEDEAYEHNQEYEYRRNRSDNRSGASGGNSYSEHNSSHIKQLHSPVQQNNSQIQQNNTQQNQREYSHSQNSHSHNSHLDISRSHKHRQNRDQQSESSWNINQQNIKNLVDRKQNSSIADKQPLNYIDNGHFVDTWKAEQYLPSNKSNKSQKSASNSYERVIKNQSLVRSRSPKSPQSDHSTNNKGIDYRKYVNQSNSRHKQANNHISTRQYHRKNERTNYQIQSSTHLTHAAHQNAEDQEPSYSTDIISLINRIYDSEKKKGIQKIRKVYSRLAIV